MYMLFISVAHDWDATYQNAKLSQGPLEIIINLEIKIYNHFRENYSKNLNFYANKNICQNKIF